MDVNEKHTWPSKILTSHVAVTPYMLTDLGIIRSHCLTFKKLFPNVLLYYAMKAFPDMQVLLCLKDVVDGFDAASIDEINRLLNIGIPADQITYSNPVKPIEAISEASLRGVNKFTFQSKSELEKIASCTQGSYVSVRTKMDDSHSAVPLSAKYGCSASEVVSLLEYAQELGLRPFGITFHVGSQQTGLNAWSKAIRKSRALLKEIQSKGIHTSIINLGGGFPVQYNSNDPSISEVSKVINAVIDPAEGFIYMAEPGRYIVAESSVIVASIIGIEERDEKIWLYLDVGLFQAFLGTVRFDPFPYPPYFINHTRRSKEPIGEPKKYILTGPSCDSQDIITFNAELPSNLRIGDRIAFPNAGAYTIVYGSEFNGFKIPPRFFINTCQNLKF